MRFVDEGIPGYTVSPCMSGRIPMAEERSGGLVRAESFVVAGSLQQQPAL